MKLVNWIFGSLFILLLIFILVEITDTPAFQNWWAGFNSEQTTEDRPSSAPVAANLQNRIPAQPQPQPLPQQQPINRQPIVDKPLVIQLRPITTPTARRTIFTKTVPDSGTATFNKPAPPAIVYQSPYNARTLKSGPVVSAGLSAINADSRSEGYLSRKITQAEINEFIRQYPERSIKIRFAFYGTCDAEMDNVKAQITSELVKNGYNGISYTWNPMNGYTSSDEVHFGPYGNSGAIIYIPPIRK